MKFEHCTFNSKQCYFSKREIGRKNMKRQKSPAFDGNQTHGLWITRHELYHSATSLLHKMVSFFGQCCSAVLKNKSVVWQPQN